MCGIFAYSGPKKGDRVLIEALKKLEYRGYDSAGVAFFESGGIKRYRVCGGVEALQKQIPKKPSSHLSGKQKTKDLIAKKTRQIGIGHTRWATHGSASQNNAHPHRSGPIYVVHNGVIENSQEIQKILPKQKALSETDTEWIAHLIKHFLDSEALSFRLAVLKSLSFLKGSFAVVCLHDKSPQEMIAFKSGPPLIVAQNGEEFFVSSDPQALPNSEKCYFLEDEELAHFKAGQLRIFNFKGEKQSPNFVKSSFVYQKAPAPKSFLTKAGQPHFMLKEILEQSQCLSRVIQSYKSSKTLAFNWSQKAGTQKSRAFKPPSQFLLLACGSSYFAGLFAKYVLEEVAQIPCQVEMASEFIYRKTLLNPQTTALFISQSGETADILIALKQIQKQGLTSLSLCNVKNSSLVRKSDFFIDMLAGPEQAVASTKSFSASLLSLVFLAFSMAKSRKLLAQKEEQSFLDSLVLFPKQIEQLLQRDSFFLKILETLKQFKNFFYLGRGLYYPIALEGALKLKEIAYLHAEAYPAGEMKHGPLALIDKNTAILALLPPPGLLYQKTYTNIKETLARGARLIAIGGEKDSQALSDHFFALPKSHPLLRPLLSLIPLQMMAYYIARSYGYNVDRPRNLAKSVTVE